MDEAERRLQAVAHNLAARNDAADWATELRVDVLKQALTAEAADALGAIEARRDKALRMLARRQQMRARHIDAVSNTGEHARQVPMAGSPARPARRRSCTSPRRAAPGGRMSAGGARPKPASPPST